MLRIPILIAPLVAIVTFAHAGYPENEGWPVPYAWNIGGPLVVDIDGNGELDVIASDGITWIDADIMAWSSGGCPLNGWPKPMSYRTNNAIPGADFDNDGRIEVVVVPHRTAIPTQAVAYRHDDTAPDGWPIDLKWMAHGGATFCDVDGDGRLEIGMAIIEMMEAEGELHLYGADAGMRNGWPKILQKQIQSTPLFADLDLDGDFEVLAGACLPYVGPGWILAYHHDGAPYADTEILAEVSSGFITNPLMTVNLTGDLHPEIIGPDRAGNLHAFDWQGNPVPGWPPAQLGFTESMAVAVGAATGPAKAIWVHSPWGTISLLDRRGRILPGWPWERDCRVYSQFIVGDLDGDPAPEGFVGPCWDLGEWAFNLDGSVCAGFPIPSNHKMGSGAGTLADLDGDGDTDIIMQFDDSVHVLDTPGVWDPDRIECARWMYDNWHTGAYHKLIYREAESANGRAGWSVASDTSAWGHAFVRPAAELIAVTERSAGGSTEARAAVARASLHYRTEVPAFKKYSLWVRARRRQDDTGATTPLPKIVATLDGFPWRPTGQVAASPGRWRWIELGRRTLQVGLHELDLSVHGAAIEIDRWLLTTHERSPILDERPHGW